MAGPNTCPQCGTPLAPGAQEGLCPKCLFQRGLESHTLPATASPQAAPRWSPPAPAELAAGFPELDLLELIGRGGMGAVYKARQKNLDRIVALKILPPEIGQDPAFAERFAREAQAMARLNHPHIVAIHEFGTRSGLYFFVMEYVDGMSLRGLLDSGHVSPREALAIVPQICEALQYAHDRGIVHRDIKPENILLNKQGQVKIADFGLAKLMGLPPLPSEGEGGGASPPGEGSSSLRSPGEGVPARPDSPTLGGQRILGTPQYMAPEQLEHPAEVDHRADIYSLGVVFYQMLTGELPVGRFAPPSKKVVIDVRLDEVVLRALEKEPGRRYQQASEVKTEVETIATTPASAPPPTSPQHPSLPVQPRTPAHPMVRLRTIFMVSFTIVSALSLLACVMVTRLWIDSYSLWATLQVHGVGIPTPLLFVVSAIAPAWWMVAWRRRAMLSPLTWRRAFRLWAAGAIIAGFFGMVGATGLMLFVPDYRPINSWVALHNLAGTSGLPISDIAYLLFPALTNSSYVRAFLLLPLNAAIWGVAVVGVGWWARRGPRNRRTYLAPPGGIADPSPARRQAGEPAVRSRASLVGTLLMHLGVFVGLMFVLVYAAPKMAAVFEDFGANLPLPTEGVLNAGMFCVRGGWVGLIFLLWIDMAICVALWKLAPRWVLRSWSALAALLGGGVILYCVVALYFPTAALISSVSGSNGSGSTASGQSPSTTRPPGPTGAKNAATGFGATGSLIRDRGDAAQWQIEALVAEEDILQVAAGQGVKITLDALPRRVFTGTVIRVADEPVRQPNLVCYKVVIQVANPDPTFKPGMTANIWFPAKDQMMNAAATQPLTPEVAMKALEGLVTSPDTIVIDSESSISLPSELRRELARVIAGATVKWGGIQMPPPDDRGPGWPRPGCVLCVLRKADVTGQEKMDRERALWEITVVDKIDFAQAADNGKNGGAYSLLSAKWKDIAGAVRELRNAKSKVDDARWEKATQHFDEVEERYLAGKVAPLDYERAKGELHVLEAELSGDPVRLAEARFDAAMAILQCVEALERVGKVTNAELRDAQAEVKLRQAELEALADASRP